jgi:3-hydroxybutyryl-CoA dehydratase
VNRPHPKPPHPGPGSALPVILRRVDQATIDAYAAVSGDHNPIHVDPDYARTGPFGRTIAHGLMTLAYVSELLNHWTGGTFDGAGEMDVTFIGPVYAGDEVRVTGTVEDVVQRDDAPCLRIRLSVTAGDRPILAGIALHPLTNSGH